MGQVTLYLPEKVEAVVKKEAKKAHKSISAYVTEILSNKLAPKKWSKNFSWKKSRKKSLTLIDNIVRLDSR